MCAFSFTLLAVVLYTFSAHLLGLCRVSEVDKAQTLPPGITLSRDTGKQTCDEHAVTHVRRVPSGGGSWLSGLAVAGLSGVQSRGGPCRGPTIRMARRGVLWYQSLSADFVIAQQLVKLQKVNCIVIIKL